MARIELRRGALVEIMRSAGMQAELRRRAEAVRSAADSAANDPGGHRAVSEVGANRARAAVLTGTPKSMWKEAVHHTLVSSIGAGRG